MPLGIQATEAELLDAASELKSAGYDKALISFVGRRYKANVLGWIPIEYHAAIQRHDLSLLPSTYVAADGTTLTGDAARRHILLAISLAIQAAIDALVAFVEALEKKLTLPFGISGPVLYFPAGLYPVVELRWDPRVFLQGEQVASTRLEFAGVSFLLGEGGKTAELKTLTPKTARAVALLRVKYATSGPHPRLHGAGAADLSLDAESSVDPKVGFAGHGVLCEERVRGTFGLARVAFAKFTDDALWLTHGADVAHVNRFRSDNLGLDVVRVGTTGAKSEPTALTMSRFTDDSGHAAVESGQPVLADASDVTWKSVLLGKVMYAVGQDIVSDPTLLWQSGKPDGSVTVPPAPWINLYHRNLLRIQNAPGTRAHLSFARLELKAMLIPDVHGMTGAPKAGDLYGPPALVLVNSDPAVSGADPLPTTLQLSQVFAADLPHGLVGQTPKMKDGKPELDEHGKKVMLAVPTIDPKPPSTGLTWVRSRNGAVRVLARGARLDPRTKLLRVDADGAGGDVHPANLPCDAAAFADSGLGGQLGVVALGGKRLVTEVVGGADIPAQRRRRSGDVALRSDPGSPDAPPLDIVPDGVARHYGGFADTLAASATITMVDNLTVILSVTSGDLSHYPPGLAVELFSAGKASVLGTIAQALPKPQQLHVKLDVAAAGLVLASAWSVRARTVAGKTIGG